MLVRRRTGLSGLARCGPGPTGPGLTGRGLTGPGRTGHELTGLELTGLAAQRSPPTAKTRRPPGRQPAPEPWTVSLFYYRQPDSLAENWPLQKTILRDCQYLLRWLPGWTGRSRRRQSCPARDSPPGAERAGAPSRSA